MTSQMGAYRVFAFDRPAGGRLRLVGTHPGYTQALAARDRDVLDQLRAGGGWYMLARHVIIGPGVQGPETVHRLATALGVSPGRSAPPDDVDLADAAHWLEATHRPASPPPSPT